MGDWCLLRQLPGWCLPDRTNLVCTVEGREVGTEVGGEGEEEEERKGGRKETALSQFPVTVLNP